jgi:hypothetical protein
LDIDGTGFACGESWAEVPAGQERHPKLTMMSAIRNRMSIDPLSDIVRIWFVLVRFMFVVAFVPIGEIDRPGAEVGVYFMGMTGYGA